MSLGLRIDVDTHDGMRDGVPSILRTLDRHGMRGSFFFSFGPDNSGRAVLRAFTKPGFVSKMLRTNAASMYGLRTALSGTLLPARPIAAKFPGIARDCAASGHEVGVHAWDHVGWQDHLHEWTPERTREQFGRAVTAFGEVFGRAPRCSAAPAWYALPHSLAVQDEHGFAYSTDCRATEPAGEGWFLPEWSGRRFETPQIAASLPTIDECLGRPGWSLERVADLWIESASRETAVATVHAEAEGRAYAGWFDSLCARMRAREIRFSALEDLAPEQRAAREALPVRGLALAEIPGRAGAVACVRGAA